MYVLNMQIEDCEKGDLALKEMGGQEQERCWATWDTKALVETSCGREREQQAEVKVKGRQ